MVHKKKQSRDKYSVLAKEQGYRARSAFKLIQLNRKYEFLSDASRVIDLCAAPGGWLQVLAKHLPLSPERQIIGVDLMPIRPIRGCVTFKADITTDKCRSMVRKEMKGAKADVVLCDGAPNVGAEYSKDAFVQNELTIHALKFACEHLRKGGTFVTKVFRASDYNALLWSFNQLFKKVDATKPPSSRNVSAEIFLVCRGFVSPHKIDARLLDPKHVLADVGEEGFGTAGASDLKAMNKLFKSDKELKKKPRHRQGYDADAPLSMHRKVSANEFVVSEEPIRLLTTTNEIHFDDDESQALLLHSATTEEIKANMADLKLLSNAEFRKLLRWRDLVRKELKNSEGQNPSSNENSNDEGSESSESDDEEGDKESSEDEEDSDDEGLSEELKRVRQEAKQRAKREKKKKRKIQAVHQRRVDMGMESEFAIDLADERGPFSLRDSGIKSAKEFGDLEAQTVVDVNTLGSSSEAESSDSEDEEFVDIEKKRANYLKELEASASIYYDTHVKKQEDNDPQTVRERRQKLDQDKKAKKKKKLLHLKQDEDFANALEKEEKQLLDKGAYSAMFEDEENSSSDNESQPQLPGTKSSKKDKVAATRSERWFSQALFKDVESDVESDDAASEKKLSNSNQENHVLGSDGEQDDSDDETALEDRLLPSERTDKAQRKLKREKLRLRNEKKAEKRQKALEREMTGSGIAVPQKGFETVPAAEKNNIEDENSAVLNQMEELEQNSEKPKWMRDLIRKGLGLPGRVDDQTDTKFEVVDQPIVENGSDEEGYNSEDYDTDERANHLALGGLMVKKSTRRKLLDSGYNRYSFNDDVSALPDWFVEDENKHYRPQLPITKEMVESVKARFKDLASKPANKVLEARGRKRRRQEAKIEKIKKKAASIVEEPDVNAKSKMREIEKLYKGAAVKRPGSVYVVSKKGGTKGVSKKDKGKNVKVVDRRLKADTHRLKNSKRKAKKAGRSQGGRGRRR